MIKLVDLTYYTHTDVMSPRQVIDRHTAALDFARFLKKRIDLLFVKHAPFEQFFNDSGVKYQFFRGRNKFWFIPLTTHRFLRYLKPDLILVQGLVFPLQVIALRMTMGRRCRIVIQHHGELPWRGLKKVFQQLACRMVNGFVFTAKANADSWIQKGIIPANAQIFEILEASTDIVKRDKQQSRTQLRLQRGLIFLWVGRLNANKDPLTVLSAFEKYLLINPEAHLYFIYQADDMLEQIRAMLAADDYLRQAVTLVGKVPHNELNKWYSAADVYLSASHKEGSGYALLVAMACGCIPGVTAIPSFQKITGDGKFGRLYPPGDSGALLQSFVGLEGIDMAKYSAEVTAHFTQKLSYQCIADDIVKLCTELMPNKLNTPDAISAGV